MESWKPLQNGEFLPLSWPIPASNTSQSECLYTPLCWVWSTLKAVISLTRFVNNVLLPAPVHRVDSSRIKRLHQISCLRGCEIFGLLSLYAYLTFEDFIPLRINKLQHRNYQLNPRNVRKFCGSYSGRWTQLSVTYRLVHLRHTV